MNPSPRLAAFAVALLAIATTASGETPTLPSGTLLTSWLGNSYMDAEGHKNVTEALHDICVSPNGHVFSAGYAETWGGGATYNAANGDFIARYDRFDTGFGDPVSAVAADNDFVYFGSSGKGILRAPHGGKWTYERFLKAGNIQGLCISNGKLYVSDYGMGKIRVLNLATMAEERSWNCNKPTRLAVDRAGNVWVVIWDRTSDQEPTTGPMWWGEFVQSFSPDGTPGPRITDFKKPLSLAFANDGKLLVGGLNEHSQIWIYDVGGKPAKVGTFGEEMGIYAGTAGAFTKSAKLHWIRSIAVDDKGSIYTGCVYGTFWGDCIEKWDTSGKLIWRVVAGTSLDCGGIDPDNETEAYTKFHHYSLDYTKTVPGSEWSLTGYTVNRFAYPNDPRVDQNSDVGERSLGMGVWKIAGKTFIGRSSQNGYMFELYRIEKATNGEVVVPSVSMGTGSGKVNRFYDPSPKKWDEYPKYEMYNQYWCLAKNGDCLTTDNGKQNVVVRYPFGGLDKHGNPIWRADSVVTYTLPEFASPQYVRRIEYDSANDVLYAGGNTGHDNYISKVVRYDHFTTRRTMAWEKALPMNDKEYTPDTNYGGGTALTLNSSGDYLFILYGYGHCRILRKDSGELVGTLKQNVNGWTGSAGQVDAAYGCTAFRRKNGEYIVLFENAAWANIMMYRWTPPK